VEGPIRPLANAVANAIDPIEADLKARILAAEMGGRRTVADLLAERLDAHRAARAGGNVVQLDSRRRA
jgi:hypothetical protein